MIQPDNKLLKILAVHIAPVSDIDSFERIGQAARIEFKTDKDWEQLYATDAQITFDEPQQPTDAGIAYTQELKLILPGDGLDLQTQLNSYAGTPLLVRFDYDNNTYKIIGDLQNWVNLLSDFSSQKFETKRSISFKKISAKPALFLM